MKRMNLNKIQKGSIIVNGTIVLFLILLISGTVQAIVDKIYNKNEVVNLIISISAITLFYIGYSAVIRFVISVIKIVYSIILAVIFVKCIDFIMRYFGGHLSEGVVIVIVIIMSLVMYLLLIKIGFIKIINEYRDFRLNKGR